MPSSPSFFDAQLDHHIEMTFAPLCENLGLEEVLQLMGEVYEHAQKAQQALKTNEFLDVKTAWRIAKVLNQLLTQYDSFPETQQKLIVGAARYFVHEQDLEPDTASILGFDDDVQVVNYVLDCIGQPELKVEL